MKFIIVGFGAAGANAAETIRKLDDSAEITVLDGEGRSFYLRLDLEGIFQGKPVAQLQPRSPEYWLEKRIQILPGRAARLDLANHRIINADGQMLDFDRLMIGSGSCPRALPIPGRDLSGVVSYHTLDHAEHITALAKQVKKAVIIGGGILGLELAHAGVDFGWDVTLLVRGGHPGSPIADPSGGQLVQKALDRRGVHVILNDEAAAFEGRDGILTAVRTRQGRVFEADLAAVCIGVAPDVDWLSDSGLLTEGKLITSERMQTSHPQVCAAGDAVTVRKDDGRLVPCHTWNVAQSQARAAAANLCGESAVWREDVLYNLDYLFDQEFAMIGAWEGRHLPGRVLHEFPEDNCFRALVTRDGILEGALLLGSREGDRRLRKIIAAHPQVDGRIPEILDPSIPAESFMTS